MGSAWMAREYQELHKMIDETNTIISAYLHPHGISHEASDSAVRDLLKGKGKAAIHSHNVQSLVQSEKPNDETKDGGTAMEVGDKAVKGEEAVKPSMKLTDQIRDAMRGRSRTPQVTTASASAKAASRAASPKAAPQAASRTLKLLE